MERKTELTKVVDGDVEAMKRTERNKASGTVFRHHFRSCIV